MITDQLEHLEVILEKKPVVGTWAAQDLLERPELVRKNYLEHARSFVILGKLNAVSDEEQLTTADYEKRLIKLVKEKGAAKGYITAEYGYGKTSTAIFIWQRCEQAEILAVPPFQIQKLDHLISATYGWVRFKLGENYPQLVAKADAIYRRYVDRSIESEGSDERVRQVLRRLHDEGRYNLGLRELDYINFFEEMTALAQQAHYNGLVVIADELQQYLETNKSNGDPLASLFNIIQVLITRKGQLPFGLLLSVATNDLGFMNDHRSDLVQRLKSDRLALDLSTIYNQTFARDLWNQLARELQFESLKDKIVLPETLEALGQISARSDLANGPRTVVDVFKLMSRRYKEQADQFEPFSPLDLVNAFLNGDISYDNTGRLQRVVSEHLSQPFVQKNLDYQKAIKLMAAFPIGGLSQHYFDTYGVRRALEDLTTEARGDIVTFAGGGYDGQGQLRETRALLVGLEDRKINTDWLTTTIREFTRGYHEQSSQSRELAVKGFQQLLKSEVFKSWKLERSLDPSFIQDRAYIFEGAFNSTRKTYPERRLHLRILAEGEQIHNTVIDGDIALNFQLALNSDATESLRSTLPGQIIYRQDKTTTIVLNMSHHSGMEYYGDLNTTLGQVVAPSTMNPILLLSLYAYLEKKRAANVIPKAEDEAIRNNFQPLLFDHALQELFNAELGASVNNAKGVRIVEELVRQELGKHYGDYSTLMTNVQWRQNLKEYRSAIEKLPTSFERQGQQPYKPQEDPTKARQEVASLFNRTVPALQTFMTVNPLLIKESSDGWSFTLHPLEKQIMSQLRESPSTERPLTPGGKARRSMATEATLKVAKEKGYRQEEFDEGLQLLEKRGLISFKTNRSRIVEEVLRVPQIDELRSALKDYLDKLKILKDVLPASPQLEDLAKEAEGLPRGIEYFVSLPNEQKQIGFFNHIQIRQRELDNAIQTEQKRIASYIGRLVHQGVIKLINTDSLNQPLTEGLFSAQVHAQRVNLLKENNEFTEKVEPLKEQLRELLAIAEQALLSASDLQRLIQSYQRLQKEIHQVDQRQAYINETIQYFSQARQLLNQAQELQRRFQSVPSDVAAIFQKELEEWSLRVKGDLSSAKLNGLKREPDWREQFDAIRRRFDAELQAEQERFARIQADYKSFLMEKFHLTESWTNVIFNLAVPQDSYNRLWDSVHEVLQQAVAIAHQEVQAVHDRAARLQGGSLLNLPPTERPARQTQLDTALLELTEYSDKTNKWVERVAALDFVERVREQGATTSANTMLKPVIANITMLTVQLPRINRTITEVEQRVLAAKLAPEEEAILVVLNDLQQETGSSDGIELGLLLQRLGGEQETSWRLLSRLYSKQRLRLKIAPAVFS